MKQRTMWLMLTPALFIIVALFLSGTALGVMQSFDYMPLIGKNDFNLSAYQEIFTNSKFMLSIGYSLYIALAATFFSIVLALVVAMVLRKSFAGKKLAVFVFQFPLPIPHIVAAIAMLLMFSQSGFLSRVLKLIGLVEKAANFPEIVQSANGFGMILSYVWKFSPFIGVALLAVLQTTGTVYEEVSTSLGANAWQRFFYVLLPMMVPSIVNSSVLCFAFAFSSFEVAFLLGASYPKTLAVEAYFKYFDINLANRPVAMAMAVVITVLTTVLVWLYKKLAATAR